MRDFCKAEVLWRKRRGVWVKPWSMRIFRGGGVGGEAEVEVEVEVDMVRVIVGMMGGGLIGRSWGLEERFLQQVIDPLRMLSCVLWKKLVGLMSCMTYGIGSDVS